MGGTQRCSGGIFFSPLSRLAVAGGFAGGGGVEDEEEEEDDELVVE